MALLKLSDFDPNYRESFDGQDIKGLGVYSEGDEKIGTVSDALVDEEGHFRYLIVDLGFWIFGKKVLLPIGRSRVDYNADRVYAVGMTRAQAENLPEFDENMAVDYDYEERVRGVYRSPAAGASVTSATDDVAPIDRSMPLDASAPLDAAYSASMTDAIVDKPIAPTYDRDTYNYEQDQSLYDVNEQAHQNIKLYQERLIANKNRRKSGEVTVGKHVETETARVAVPIEKERVVIERTTPVDAGRAVSPGTVDFREGEVARVEMYEETADIHKEAFVREEVNVKKVVDRDTVEAEETLRREELDVNTGNLPIDEKRDRI